MSRKIIAFSGPIGAGKSTAADILVEHHGFVRMALADPLYSIAGMLGFKRISVGGQKQKETPTLLQYPDFGHSLWCALSEVIQLSDEELAEIYGRIMEALAPHLTPGEDFDSLSISLRGLLVAIGTAGRKVCPDYWSDRMHRRLCGTSQNVVIDDARFENEEVMVRKLGGTILRIRRDTAADFFADIHNSGTKSDLRHQLATLLGAN